MSIEFIKLWFEKVRPDPQPVHLNIQAGVHAEEFCEMLAAMRGEDEYSDLMLDRLHTAATVVALGLKQGTIKFKIRDRKEFLDSLADQIVTATGVGHCAKMEVVEAVRRVNHSNFTKFDVDGKPLFDKNGKLAKGPNYEPPNLSGLY